MKRHEVIQHYTDDPEVRALRIEEREQSYSAHLALFALGAFAIACLSALVFS